MAFFAGATVVFFSVLSNHGFSGDFLFRWVKGFCVSYVVLVPFIFFVAPKVQQIAERILKKDE